MQNFTETLHNRRRKENESNGVDYQNINDTTE